MKVQACYFCGRSVPEIDKITKEHVFGDWSETALPAQAPGHAVTVSELDRTTGDIRDRSYRAPVPLSDARVHGYCNECNNGWMNDLDAVVRREGPRLFYGGDLHLSVELMTSIASWATKLTIVKDTQDYKDGGAIRQERRTWLYANRTPPPRTWVWAACLSEEAGTLAIRHLTRFVETDWFAKPDVADLRALRANTSFTTFSYHRLAVVVLCTDSAGLSIDNPAELFPGAIIRLWPHPAETSWPPHSTISNELLVELSEGDWIHSIPVSQTYSPEGKRYIQLDP
jgi:hypothetical protein